MRISKLLIILFLLSIFSFAQTTPAPPANLKLTISGPNTVGRGVMLSWEYTMASADVKFNVYKKPGLIADTTNPFNKIATIPQKMFVDSNVRPGDQFSYYVTAVVGAEESLPSNLVDGELNPPPPPPPVSDGQISGNLYDDSTLAPIPRGNVQIFPAQITASCGPGLNIFTDSLGNFSAKIKTGEYFIYSFAPGYFGEYFDNVKTLKLATKITLNEGDSLVFHIGLARIIPPVTNSVSGWVKDSLGNPQMADLTAYIINRQPSPSCWEMNYRAKTDSMGNYKFNNVRPNDTLVVYVESVKHTFLPQYYNGKTTYADADRISVTGNVTDINITLVAKPFVCNGITGSVKDSAGVTPVTGQVFAFQKLKGHISFKGMANTDSLTGVYSFSNLEQGLYYFLARGLGYKPSFYRLDGTPTLNWRLADSINISQLDLLAGVNFRLLPCEAHSGGGFVFGNIKGIDGSALPGVLSYVEDTDNNFVDYTVSDMDGSYLIGNLEPGNYTLVSTLVNYNNNESPISVDYLNNSTFNIDVNLSPDAATGLNDNSAIINGYSLNQNYPNPFNPSTIISYQIQNTGLVTLKLYNILGKEVATLVNENQNAGKYNYTFKGGNLASGVYFYRLQAGSFVSIKKMTLLK